MINVIGDVGLVIGAFLLFDGTGALDYATVFEEAEDAFGTNDAQIVAACVMLLVGAFAKSAQVPLHTWLPDAMEGPTPVSALIHAATMVTAGVYLIARMHPLFELAPTAADVGAIIGTATLLIAATIAVTATDLKRVIAYSTMSQIGYMVLGVSVAAYGAGLFHLMTHAFFKALLFMGAGSVIARHGRHPVARPHGRLPQGDAVHVRDLHDRRAGAGGLPAHVRLLLEGRDPRLHAQPRRRLRGPGVAGYVAAGLTAFYAFRMVFRVFWGDPVPEARELEQGHLAHAEHANPATGEEEDTDVGFPGPEHHMAEQAWPMKAAMAPLALLAIVAERSASRASRTTLEHFLEPTFEDSRFHDTVPTDSEEVLGLGVGGAIALLGIAAAALVYLRRPGTRRADARALRRGAHLPREQVVLRRAHRSSCSCRPAAAFGRFGRTVDRERVRAGRAGGRHRRASCAPAPRSRAGSRPASCAATPSCWSPGSAASSSTSW